MVSNLIKISMCKSYIKTNKLVNYINNNNSYEIIYLFIYATLLFKTKIHSAPVLKYHGDVMRWCPEGDYSAIK